MTPWPFTTREKEQDTNRDTTKEERVQNSSEGESQAGDARKPGTGDLNALIAATGKQSPGAPKKTYTQSSNTVSQSPDLEPKSEKSGSTNVGSQSAQPQIARAEKNERLPQGNLTQEFGILSIEEQQRIDNEMAKPPEEKKTPAKRKTLGRKNEVKVRLTDDEKKLLDTRVWASGLTQGEFVRLAMLHEKIETRSVLGVDARSMTELMKMGSELGKIGGLLKKTVVTNKEFSVLTPEEKSKLEKLMKELELLKTEIQRMVQDIYGHT